MRHKIDILTTLAFAASAIAFGAGGCVLITNVDRGLIPGEGGMGGQASSTTSTTTAGTGGATSSTTSAGGGGTATTSTSSTSSTTSTSSTSSTTTSVTCPTTGGTTCQIAGDCPVAPVCQHATCDTQSCCGVANDTLGTTAPAASQVAGDCHIVICDGNGATKSQVDDGDVPADANDCSVGTCNLGTPGQSARMVGIACSSNGGKLCDGAGACVECLADADCTADPLKSHCSGNACVAAACTDQVKDGLETDTDCGGGPASGCSTCADGKHCVVNSDCASSSLCKAGICTAASCTDGMKNGSETDVDCGGTTCVGQGKTCALGLACAVNADCTSAYCVPVVKVCATPSCTDGIWNQDEADVDCGGSCTVKCGLGQPCNGASDCATGYCDASKHCAKLVTGQGPCSSGVMCESGFCALPEGVCCATDCTGACQACSAARTGGADGTCAPVTAGTDPDSECNDEGAPTCGTTGMCNGSGACALYASGTECVAASCGAGPVLNAAQTCDGSGVCSAPATTDCSPYNCANGACPTGCAADADCVATTVCTTGGLCAAPAENGQPCGADKECTSGHCYGSPMICHADLCADGVKDGAETDVDCGGGTCAACAAGQACAASGDCAAPNVCLSSGTATPLTCGAPLADGSACGASSDCTGGYCYGTPAVCRADGCGDGVKNGAETDVDCGGGTCATCAAGKACAVDADCASSMCYAGLCVATINGCNVATATDLTGVTTTTVAFGGANGTKYVPACIKVKAGTAVTFNGNFTQYSLQGGTVTGGAGTPATSGPFIPATTSGNTKAFTMSSAGTFPYYAIQQTAAGMMGAVFVVP